MSGEGSIRVQEDRYIAIEGVRLRYWEAGRGDQAVILVHGVGSYIERWRHTFEVLARRMRVYAIDLPGRGLSDKPKRFAYHVSHLAQMVRQFVDAMGIGTVSLVGSSLGGAIVGHFALQFPDAVDRLVLSSSAGWGRGVTGALRIAGFPGIGELIGMRQSKESAKRLLESIVRNPSVVTDELVDLQYRMNAQPGAWEAFLRLLRSNGSILGQSASVFRPLRAGLRTFPRPVLILWGDHDRIIPPKHALTAAATLPEAEIRVFEDCGHFLMLEEPDEYAALVSEFLTRPPTGTRSSES